MLDAKYSIYSNGQITKLRTMAYSVPDHLKEHVDIISPSTYFGGFQSQRTRVEAGDFATALASANKRQLQTSCEEVLPYGKRNLTVITPKCLMELYNTKGYEADPKSGSTVAFAKFLNGSASCSDLALFQKQFNLPPQEFKVLALINGGVDDRDLLTESDGEANLDSQTIIGLVDGLPVSTYITGGVAPFIPDLLSPTKADDQNEPYLEFYNYLLSQPNAKLPYVISNSPE